MVIKNKTYLKVTLQFLIGILFSIIGWELFKLLLDKLYYMDKIDHSLYEGGGFYQNIVSPIFCLLGIIIIDKFFYKKIVGIWVGIILDIILGIIGSIIGYQYETKILILNILLAYSFYQIITTVFCMAGYYIGKKIS